MDVLSSFGDTYREYFSHIKVKFSTIHGNSPSILGIISHPKAPLNLQRNNLTPIGRTTLIISTIREVYKCIRPNVIDHGITIHNSPAKSLIISQ